MQMDLEIFTIVFDNGRGDNFMKLGIYGLGAMGKSLFSIIYSKADSEERENFVLVDDVVEDREFMGYSIITFEEMKELYSNDKIELITLNGDPHVRKILFDKIINNGYRMGTYVDSDAFIDETVTIGEGSALICEGVYVLLDAKIGKNSLVYNSNVGHHVTVKDHCTLSSRVVIAGYCEIGDESYIGANASLSDGIKVGDRSIVTIGAALFKNVPDESIAIGSPAKILKRDINKGMFSGH